MKNLIVRQLVEGRKQPFPILLSKYFGFKIPKVIDRVIPDVSKNLRSSA